MSAASGIREIQATVGALAVRDLGDLFTSVNSLEARAARDVLLETVPAVATAYADVAAAGAGEWFETMREREVGKPFPAKLASVNVADPMRESVRFSAQHLFTDSRPSMRAYLAGQLTKWVNQGAQETVIQSIEGDPIGVGWQRVTRPGACSFCLALADNGAVYTRRSVWFASHANCNCAAEPSWDPSLPEVDVMAYRASQRWESLRRRAANKETEDDIKRLERRYGKGGRLPDSEVAKQILADHRREVREWIELRQS